ncbi:MAG: hypothetical protein K0S65_1137 [Labilithrix sp.]|nr:hypothetical protein [Labilithrix sp.]
MIRPLTARAPTAPRAPTATPTFPKANDSNPDREDDATNVMPRPVFDNETVPLPLPKTKPTAGPRPAAGRPARPDVDLVPQTQRRAPPSERTVVMPNAPVRPPSATAKTGAMPTRATPSAHGRLPTHAASAPPAPAPRFPSVSSPGGPTTRAGSGSLPPPPARTSSRPLDPPPPRTARPTTIRPQPLAHQGTTLDHDELEALRRLDAPPLVQPFPAPRTSASMTPPPMPPQDETAALVRGNWTPSAPPIAFGPTAQAPRQTQPPPNVRVRPPSVAPPPAVHSFPPPGILPASNAQAPGLLGLVLFAAPLAFATMAVAALALL